MNDIELHKQIRSAIKRGETEVVAALIGNDQARLNMMTPFGTWLHVAANRASVKKQIPIN